MRLFPATTYLPVARQIRGTAVLICLMAVSCVGCYAPIHSPGVEARKLPDFYRWPTRTVANPLNYSHLVRQVPSAYILGPGDKLSLIAPDLIQQGSSEPVQVEILENGEITVPRLGAVSVAGLTLSQAHQKVNEALSAGLLANPQTVLTLAEKGTVNVLVLGAVQSPGVHALPRFQNDVAHALAAAQGFSEEAGEHIEIHRQNAHRDVHHAPELPCISQTSSRTYFVPEVIHAGYEFHRAEAARQTTAAGNTLIPAGGPVLPVSAASSFGTVPSRSNSLPSVPAQLPLPDGQFSSPQAMQATPGGPSAVEFPDAECLCIDSPIVRIPLRGDNQRIDPADVVLNAGDVVVIPQKTDKVFYVVGPLSEQNRLRFSVGDRDRQIGNGLLLPDDREIDVVTAVAMAGYIDPINSPTTVTLHRVEPGCKPLLVRVDLIAARSDPRETILVQPGDIIYLNPDPWWYSRRLTDRIVERALGTAIGRWLTN